MKYLLVLAILLTSLCVGLPIDLPEMPGLPFDVDSTIERPGVFVIDQGSPDLYMSVETIPQEVKSERELTLILELRNKNEFELTNIDVEVYDPCIFSNDITTYSPDGDSLHPNQTALESWDGWIAGETTLEKNCEIKINTGYNGVYSLYQDIAVLSDSEYRIRELEGTIYNVPIKSYSSSNPFYITLTFPEKQPFRSDTSSYTMHLDYYKTGIGFLDINSGDITINIPDNIISSSIDCGDDYTNGAASNQIVLDKDLKFINNKALRTTCNFRTAVASGPLDIKSLSIIANYRYTIDSSVSVKVRPGTSEDMPKPSTGTSSSTETGTLCADVFSLSTGVCVAEGACGGTCYYQAADCQEEGMCCCNTPQPEPEPEPEPQPEPQTCSEQGGNCGSPSICNAEGGSCVTSTDCSLCCCIM